MNNVLIFIFGVFIQQRCSNGQGIGGIYLSKNMCKIDGSQVDTHYAISILYTRSFLNCVSACYQHPECESVIFDKSTHYCQMNREILPEDTSSCGQLIYVQLYEESPPSSPCCSSSENFSSIGTTFDPQEQTTSGPTFTHLPSVDMYIYIGPQTKNIFDASNKCRQMGGELVKLDTAEKQNAVREHIINTAPNEDNFYIGLFPKLLGWGWPDGTSSYYYENWSRSPGLLENCAAIDRNENYGWVGTSCFVSFAYICEQS